MTREHERGNFQKSNTPLNHHIISWGELSARAQSGNVRNREGKLEMMCSQVRRCRTQTAT